MLQYQPFVLKTTETLDFKAFMKGERTKNTVISKKSPVLYSFIPLNPAAMIDPVFISIAAGVLLVALIEKGIADSGGIGVAAFISGFLKISFPVVGLASIWYLVSKLQFLFW